MFKKQVLQNGLRIITAPMAGAKTATVLIAVAAGSKYETKQNNGIAHFLEHMFFKGTKKRPDTLAISEELDRVGGAYNAFTAEEYTGYWAKVDYKHLNLAFDVVSDIFLNSELEEKEIEREKGVIIEEINMYHDMPMRYVGILFNKLLYKDQPAGRMITGTKENITRLQRKDFLQYLQNYYVAENAVVCLAGNIQLSAVSCQLSAFSKNIRTGDFQPKQRTIEKQIKPKTLIFHKDSDQTHLCLGVRGYSLFHPDKYALSVLGVLLGGMMSSRLWIVVRERQGLAYYVHTEVENQTDVGYLVSQAGVEHGKVEKAIKLILKEYQRMKDEKIGKKELQKVKDCIKGRMMLELESSDSMASFVCGQEILEKEILTPEQIFARIDQVSAEDIRRVANDIFQNKKLNLAVICPKKLKLQPVISLE